MAANDIGIDLGTTSTLVYVYGEGIKLREPSVVAMNTNTGEILSFGEDALKMVGKTPPHISADFPLKDGVVSDYDLTKKMLTYYIQKVCEKRLVKPRIAICTPSMTTDVEAKALVEAAQAIGARQVFLIEEPVAAALGVGIDISQPEGNMIVDIGGGTCDIAVLSLCGVVESGSIKIGGGKFDRSIIKLIRDKYKVQIGERSAENLKVRLADVSKRDTLSSGEVKGRNLVTGLPVRLEITSADIYDALKNDVYEIVKAVKLVTNKTPPELLGDILTNGIYMTGGGSMLRGLAQVIADETGTKVMVAHNAIECVAVGTGLAFDHIEDLKDAFKPMDLRRSNEND